MINTQKSSANRRKFVACRSKVVIGWHKSVPLSKLFSVQVERVGSTLKVKHSKLGKKTCVRSSIKWKQCSYVRKRHIIVCHKPSIPSANNCNKYSTIPLESIWAARLLQFRFSKHFSAWAESLIKAEINFFNTLKSSFQLFTTTSKWPIGHSFTLSEKNVKNVRTIPERRQKWTKISE